MNKLFWLFSILSISFTITMNSQNIKSVQLRPLQENSFSAIVPFGTTIELSFDDLEADSKDYQYKIQHMTHNWKPSRLLTSQYIDGFDQNYLTEITNSFNTFQSYTHYKLTIPNINTVITKSGNYLLSILNNDDETVFTRRFVYYENNAIVGVAAVRSRSTKTVNTQQTIEFSVNHPGITINNPQQEIKVALLKNNNWNTTITDLQPTFFQQNQLRYTYTNKTNFWGNNEYLNFDTKIVRNNSLNVFKVERKEVFHHFLYPYKYEANLNYSYNPDINGQFVIRTIEANNANTEADYAMMHFFIEADYPFVNQEIHIYGAFNDFKIEDATKMQYNESQKMYEGNVLLKQGFYNYTFVGVDENDNVNTRLIRGSFFETENEYNVIVYYRPIGGFYDRVIGIGAATFNLDR